MPAISQDPRPEEHYDILIVGGGPTGSTAALLAARKGLRVGLVDKARFPRDKVCGDGISPGTVQLLHDIGLNEFFDADVPIQQVDIRGVDGVRLFADLPLVDGQPVMGYVVPRVDFDQRIHVRAIEAGAVDLSGMEFLDTAINGDDHSVTLRTDRGVNTVRTSLLIGADGAYSQVRRSLEVAMAGASQSSVAMRAYAKTDQFDLDSDAGTRLMIEFSEEFYPGYGWIFPTGRGLINIGVGMAIHDLKKRDVNLRELFTRYVRLNESRGITIGELHDQRAHQLPLIGTMPQLVHPRAALLGDAASMINPLSGEGIFYGIQSAIDLMARIPSSLQRDQLNVCLRRFERSFRRTHWAHFTSTRIACLMSRYPRWASTVVTAARDDEAVMRDAIDLLFGAGRIKLSTTLRILRSGW